MKELDFVRKEMQMAYRDYLEIAENIWRSERIEKVEDKEKAFTRMKKQYENRIRFLELLEAKLEGCFEDLEYYKRKYRKEDIEDEDRSAK